MNSKKEYIGKELRIQRYYYNKLNKIGYALDDTYSSKSKSLAEDLEDYLVNHFEYMFQETFKPRENKGERSKDPAILSYLENNTSKSKKECNYNSYYLRIYCIFKLYGFLDDFEIFRLLYKYKIIPKNDKSKIESNNIKFECAKEYKQKSIKQFVRVNYPVMAISNDIIIKIVKEKEQREILELSDLNLPQKVESLILPCSKSDDKMFDKHKIKFDKLLKLFIEDITKLSKEDRQCISLDLGKESSFIDDFLQNKIEYITFETLLNITKYLNLIDTDYGIILNELKNANMEDRNFIFDYPDIEQIKEFCEILQIYE